MGPTLRFRWDGFSQRYLLIDISRFRVGTISVEFKDPAVRPRGPHKPSQSQGQGLYLVGGVALEAEVVVAVPLCAETEQQVPL